ncbi:unnamed protein product [Arctia plantaginis]|uniref:Major facilitator superfamily (MFS) profile domain-containing protein n=1 Tax=Arctia plantaginis TaxID=874455 RepID=A0A8S0ZKH2_ARCPL|nr:unnamed protein product [Arctia plantaginis]
MIISLCFSGTITYSMELYPTSVRGTLLGLGAFGARLATMISTITPILNTISEGLPTMFFGGLAIISSGLLILVPETKHLPLFDTIEQLGTTIQQQLYESNLFKNEPLKKIGSKRDGIVNRYKIFTDNFVNTCGYLLESI